MAKVTFITQSSRSADDAAFSSERLVNRYSEQGPQGAKGALLLRSVPGTELFADLSTNTLRAAAEVGGIVYAVGGGKLWSISSSGNVAELGAVSDDVVTTIAGNGSYVTITCGGKYYVWDGSVISLPSGGAFTDIGSLTYQDQRTIITEKDGDRFEWTDLANPESRQALNVARNESKNDNTLRVLADRREIWFFGEDSIEVWFNTGQSGPDALERINGGALETGCLGAMLSVKLKTGVFFIGNDGLAYVTNGLGLRAVSTPAVNYSIEASTPTHCFYYEDRGHKFCVVRFSDRPAWCYDLTTGLWHERSTGVDLGAWSAVTAFSAFGNWYIGTAQGEVHKLVRNNTDVGHPLKRVEVSRELQMAGRQFSVSELEWLGTVGESDLGRNAVLSMRISKDGGRTYGAEMTRSLGDIGDRTLRQVFRSLGRYRSFVVEFSITDPAEINTYSDVNVRAG